MYHIVNSKGQYLCVSKDLSHKLWRSPQQLKRTHCEGLLSYTAANAHLIEQARSSTPKQQRVGKELWQRPDYPDMEGSCTQSAAQLAL